MPGDDASVMTPGRMKKEAGLHSHNRDLITSSTLSPGSNPGHGESTCTHTRSLCQCTVCLRVYSIHVLISRGQQISKYYGVNLMGNMEVCHTDINTSSQSAFRHCLLETDSVFTLWPLLMKCVSEQEERGRDRQLFIQRDRQIERHRQTDRQIGL